MAPSFTVSQASSIPGSNVINYILVLHHVYTVSSVPNLDYTDLILTLLSINRDPILPK